MQFFCLVSVGGLSSALSQEKKSRKKKKKDEAGERHTSDMA